MTFNAVCLGGTFDHFHKGHKALLKLALSLGNKVVIGVTSDNYVEKSKIPTSLKLRGASKIKNSKLIESYKIRRKSIIDFLEKENALNRAKIIPIDDLFGPTLDKDFEGEAIVVVEKSLAGAEIINKERQERGLEPFQIVIAKTALSADGKPISSSRVRAGEINREGKPYINPLWFNKNLFITNSLRKILGKPLGKLIKDISEYKQSNAIYTTTVGDVTTKTFNTLFLVKNISIIDFKINRIEEFKDVRELGFCGKEIILDVKNPAGCITADLFKTILKSVIFIKDGKTITIKIEGEEDLAVLPLVLALPLGSEIFYGQRGGCIVRIEVSEEQKERIYNLVSQFQDKP